VFVCICNGVTEKQIQDAVCSGAGDLAELRGCLGVAAGCGTCAAFAEQIILETLQTNALPENRAAAYAFFCSLFHPSGPHDRLHGPRLLAAIIAPHFLASWSVS